MAQTVGQNTQALRALADDLGSNLVGHAGSRRVRAGREAEGMDFGESSLLGKREGLLEVLLGLTREANDDIGGNGRRRQGIADERHLLQELLGVVAAPHAMKHTGGTRLQRQMEMWRHAISIACKRGHELGRDLGRLDARCTQQCAMLANKRHQALDEASQVKRLALLVDRAVSSQVDAREVHFERTFAQNLAHLLLNKAIGGRQRLAASPPHDAVRALIVAAVLHFNASTGTKDSMNTWGRECVFSAQTVLGATRLRNCA